MSIAETMYRQSLIRESNRAEMDLLRSSSELRSLAGSNSKNLEAVSKAETRIQQKRIQAQATKKAADAQLKAMKNKNKKNKLDVTV